LHGSLVKITLTIYLNKENMMNNHVEQTVYRFIKKHFSPEKGPLILGLSGGPDSLALFFILLKLRRWQSFDLLLAHVDHQWRPESGQEAKDLQKLVEENQLPFHLKTLDMEKIQGNKEAACREERLKFFGELKNEFAAQALLLGHHADDQAETVLKRAFEGASLAHLSSLQGVKNLYGMSVWRPLIELTKTEITSWLDQNGLRAFEDSTNLDPAFLRGRMRTDLLPQLSKTFGKEVQKSLCRLGLEAAELKEYLDNETEELVSRVEKGPFGYFLDLSGEQGISPLILKHIFRRICSLIDLNPSRDILDKVIQAIAQGSANRSVEMEKKKIYIDRRRIFLLTNDLPCLSEKTPLENDSSLFGEWVVEVKEIQEPEALQVSNWKDLWRGKVSVQISSSGELFVEAPQANSPYPGKSSLGKLWNKHQVPAFLRNVTPVLSNEGKVIHEFLSGKCFSCQEGPMVHISLQLRYTQSG
jgi:tRNA(Ile)-lysidine synthase